MCFMILFSFWSLGRSTALWFFFFFLDIFVQICDMFLWLLTWEWSWELEEIREGESCMDVSWTVKKAECQKIDAFELLSWIRLLRVPWTARRSNQPILKEISPGCSLEGLMLKLKLQYFGHPMRSWLTGKDPDAGRDWGQEEKGTTEDEMAECHHQLNGHEFE